MFRRTRKHINILVSRYGASVYQDGRYLCIDVKLSVKSSRDRNALRDVMNAIKNVVGLQEKNATPEQQDSEIMDNLETLSQQIQVSEKSQ